MEITSSAINAVTSSGHVYLGGSGSSFGTQFSGSLMEYRLWSEPLSQSIFDNHTKVPRKNTMEITIRHHMISY